MDDHHAPGASAHLPLRRALAQLQAALHFWRDAATEHPVTPSLDDAGIAARLSRYDFLEPRALASLTDDVADLLEHGTLLNVLPRYFGLFQPGVRAAGLVADTLAAFYNLQLGTAWHAPAAAAMERRALDYFARRFGVRDGAPPSCFTSGGSESNLCGLLAALYAKWPLMAEEGVAASGVRPVFYVSDQAHDSFLKIARVAGLGSKALRRVRSDACRRMDVSELKHRVATDRARGEDPFLVVATVGTTAMGAIDPVVEIEAFCRQQGLWLHADAAWGGIAALSDQHTVHVAGLALADSVTCDAHKIMPVPTGVAMFVCRNGDSVRRVFDTHPVYVPHLEEAGSAAYQYSLQWSRRAMGLKVFMTLAELGAEGLQAIVDRQFAMADRLRRLLTDARWRVVNDSPLPVVCFVDSGGVNSDTIARGVVDQGAVWISTVKDPDGNSSLRACITHHEVTDGDVAVLLDALDRARARAFASTAARVRS